MTALGNKLLLGLAERADMIVDFTNVAVGNYVLGNVGPDEPFKGFNADGTLADGAGGALAPSDPATTGQIMQFAVVPAVGCGPVHSAAVPHAPGPRAACPPQPSPVRSRSSRRCRCTGTDPAAAMLGTVDAMGMPMMNMWSDPVTENPAVGATEVWEFYNFTADAHPMHVHEVVFEVVNREALVLDPDTGEPVQPVQLSGNVRLPEPSERGFKDTVTAYPGEVTRIRAQFNTPGQFVWHCHIVDHEDNEMMRPYRIGPVDPAAPTA